MNKVRPYGSGGFGVELNFDFNKYVHLVEKILLAFLLT